MSEAASSSETSAEREQSTRCLRTEAHAA